ncbi:uncharacterized protein LOC124830581 [Vigna umbellata]|uniref:uncharacterized protein LOC124830581 n=1 Tax=Vigna umbellata TaxID=87088 RepID=UPI001F5FAB06|nr:uncharacterized protein LOC124830581 [Vigna umbellata]
MGSEIENPTNTQQPHNQHNPNIASTQNHGYESVTNKSESTYRCGGDDVRSDSRVTLVHPHSLLPMPVPPQNFQSNQNDVALPTFSVGSFFRQRSSDLSAAIVKRVSSLRESVEEDNDGEGEKQGVTEFNLSGVKVVVTAKPEEEEASLRGRISFFSRSNCRDCTAVRRFFREKGLRFVEINVDVFSERERELRERTGTGSVPQIFFNEKLIGGLVALNSLRNSGEFDRRVAEILGGKAADGNAPWPPAYGFDCAEEDREDEMVGVVRVLRLRLPIQDRLRRMKMVNNCFEGNDLVEAPDLSTSTARVRDLMTHLPPSQIWHQVFNSATAQPFGLTGIQPFGFTMQVSGPYKPLVQEEGKNREVNPSRPLGNSLAIPRSKSKIER